MDIAITTVYCPLYTGNLPLFIQDGRGTATSSLATTTTVTTSHQLHPLGIAYSYHKHHVQAGGGTSFSDDALELENGRGNCQKYMH